MASREFFVDIIDDGEFEGPEFESFIVAISLLSGDNNGVDIGQSMVQFFIQDNEIMPSEFSLQVAQSAVDYRIHSLLHA